MAVWVESVIRKFCLQKTLFINHGVVVIQVDQVIVVRIFFNPLIESFNLLRSPNRGLKYWPAVFAFTVIIYWEKSLVSDTFHNKIS
jgi:hypothetical protein